MTVKMIHVKMVVHVWMQSIFTHVYVKLAGQGKTVKQVSSSSKVTPILIVMKCPVICRVEVSNNLISV